MSSPYLRFIPTKSVFNSCGAELCLEPFCLLRCSPTHIRITLCRSVSCRIPVSRGICRIRLSGEQESFHRLASWREASQPHAVFVNRGQLHFIGLPHPEGLQSGIRVPWRSCTLSTGQLQPFHSVPILESCGAVLQIPSPVLSASCRP